VSLGIKRFKGGAFGKLCVLKPRFNLLSVFGVFPSRCFLSRDTSPSWLVRRRRRPFGLGAL
jgi:hypothetical protein